MQKHDRVRWVYSSLGLWLIVSPFLFLGGQASLIDAKMAEMAILMLSGLMALWVACLIHPRQGLMQAMAGLTLGLSMIAMPYVPGFDGVTAVIWNLQACGAVFVLSALLELYGDWADRRTQ